MLTDKSEIYSHQHTVGPAHLMCFLVSIVRYLHLLYSVLFLSLFDYKIPSLLTCKRLITNLQPSTYCPSYLMCFLVSIVRINTNQLGSLAEQNTTQEFRSTITSVTHVSISTGTQPSRDLLPSQRSHPSSPPVPRCGNICFLCCINEKRVFL